MLGHLARHRITTICSLTQTVNTQTTLFESTHPPPPWAWSDISSALLCLDSCFAACGRSGQGAGLGGWLAAGQGAPSHPGSGKSTQSGPKIEPKLPQIQTKVGPKLRQSRAKAGPKSDQSWPNVGPSRSKVDPKSAQSRLKVGSKSAQSRSEVNPKSDQSWPTKSDSRSCY